MKGMQSGRTHGYRYKKLSVQNSSNHGWNFTLQNARGAKEDIFSHGWVGRYTTSLWVQSPYCELQLQIFTRKKQSSANLSEKICQYCTYLSRWKLKFQLWLWPTLYRWLVLWFESKSCIQFNKHWLRPWWFAIGNRHFRISMCTSWKTFHSTVTYASLNHDRYQLRDGIYRARIVCGVILSWVSLAHFITHKILIF